jgi:NAD+ kinase
LNFRIEKVGLIVNRKKAGAAALARKLHAWLKKRGKVVLADGRDAARRILAQADLIVCLGGDGTILNTADRLRRSVPVVGINLGRLGFLTTVRREETFSELDAILSGSSTVEERIMLEAKLRTAKGTQIFRGLNDVVIDRAGLTRYLHIEVRAGGEDLMSFSGDGVIIATPTGSSAYSLSAGGPFVYPTLDNFVVTPLCAHALLVRPVVLPTEKVIHVALHAAKQEGNATFTIDGQTRKVISPKDHVEITKAPLTFRLIHSSQRSYLSTLAEKFGMLKMRE